MNRGTRSLDQDTAQEWPLAVGIRNIERFVCNNPYTTRFKESTATCQMQVAARVRRSQPCKNMVSWTSLVEHGPSGRAYEYNAAGMD